jgi:hypothetical protein
LSAETYRFKDHLKPIFDDLVVLNKNLLTLESNHLNLDKAKVKVEFSRVDTFKQTIFSYVPLNVDFWRQVSN